ncbi:MAG: POTRA domain-containing protein, partial [Saprospiraceae bacterium]|nr:POTRA domain-containing protein [Saprospiraceae bacterium]
MRVILEEFMKKQRLFMGNTFANLVLFFSLILGSVLSPSLLSAQSTDTIPILEYSDPADYEIGGITVTGADFSDDNAIISISGLSVGEKVRIPGGSIPQAIKALWKLRLFTDVQILIEKTVGNVVFLEIVVRERPRLTGHSFRGVKKSKHDDLSEEVNNYLTEGGIVTENVKVNAAQSIERFFIDDGYLDAQVEVEEVVDSSRINAVKLIFNIDRGDRIKIKDITFSGNENIKDNKLRKQMENTKRKRRLFASSKFIRKSYEEDKSSIVDFYNTLGFRDARILNDSLWRGEKGDLR